MLSAIYCLGAMPVGDSRVFVEDTQETLLVPIGRGWVLVLQWGGGCLVPLLWLIKDWDYWLWTTIGCGVGTSGPRSHDG